MYRTGISAAVLRELLLHLEFRVVALYYNTFFFFFPTNKGVPIPYTHSYIQYTAAPQFLLISTFEAISIKCQSSINKYSSPFVWKEQRSNITRDKHLSFIFIFSHIINLTFCFSLSPSLHVFLPIVYELHWRHQIGFRSDTTISARLKSEYLCWCVEVSRRRSEDPNQKEWMKKTKYKLDWQWTIHWKRRTWSEIVTESSVISICIRKCVRATKKK